VLARTQDRDLALAVCLERAAASGDLRDHSREQRDLDRVAEVASGYLERARAGGITLDVAG
jgi:hypothetical protein